MPLTRQTFNALLRQKETLVIDGGLATSLEQRGNDVSGPLWSGLVLHNRPMEIQNVHFDYYMNGADIAITSSYQLSIPGVVKELQFEGADAIDLFKQTVSLAQEARRQAVESDAVGTRHALIAGSIGPYGAYLADGSEYSGDYHLPRTVMKDFHRPRIAALIDAGADLLALETMPNFEEIAALLELLAEDFSETIAWLSCTLSDAHHLADGTSLDDLLELVNTRREQIVAFGVNCVPPGLVTSFLHKAKSLTSIPLLCYPNSGETWDGQRKCWLGVSTDKQIASMAVSEWQQAGARLIGGCCRTTHEDTRRLAIALGRVVHPTRAT